MNLQVTADALELLLEERFRVPGKPNDGGLNALKRAVFHVGVLTKRGELPETPGMVKVHGDLARAMEVEQLRAWGANLSPEQKALWTAVSQTIPLKVVQEGDGFVVKDLKELFPRAFPESLWRYKPEDAMAGALDFVTSPGKGFEDVAGRWVAWNADENTLVPYRDRINTLVAQSARQGEAALRETIKDIHNPSQVMRALVNAEKTLQEGGPVAHKLLVETASSEVRFAASHGRDVKGLVTLLACVPDDDTKMAILRDAIHSERQVIGNSATLPAAAELLTLLTRLEGRSSLTKALKAAMESGGMPAAVVRVAREAGLGAAYPVLLDMAAASGPGQQELLHAVLKDALAMELVWLVGHRGVSANPLVEALTAHKFPRDVQQGAILSAIAQTRAGRPEHVALWAARAQLLTAAPQ